MTTLKRRHMDALIATTCLTAGAGIALSFLLAFLEARFAVKPDYIWLEVVAGVLAVGLPVRGVRQHYGVTLADAYEQMIVIGFVGAGMPIIIWQLWIAFS